MTQQQLRIADRMIAIVDAARRVLQASDPREGSWPCGYLHVNPVEPEPSVENQDQVNKFHRALIDLENALMDNDS